jgi:hypothetical protein
VKQDDEYEAWLNERRDVMPRADLADRIMAQVETSTESPGVTMSASSGLRLRIGPILLCAAASLVFAIRIAAFVGNLVFPTGSYPEFAVDQHIEDLPNDHRNVSRS